MTPPRARLSTHGDLVARLLGDGSDLCREAAAEVRRLRGGAGVGTVHHCPNCGGETFILYGDRVRCACGVVAPLRASG